MRAKRRMTDSEFEAILPLLNISENRMKASRMALVEGQTLQGVANIFGWTRQAVGDAVDVVWRTFERYHEAQRATANAGTQLPPGWEKVTLIAPSHLITKFRAEIAQLSPKAMSQPLKKPLVKRRANAE